MILALTMLPASNFRGHAHRCLVTWVPFTDRALKWYGLGGNVLRFVPFGLTCPLGRSRSRAVRLVLVGALALVLSLGAEAYPVYCHNRFAPATDALFNLVGAASGARLGPAGRARA